MEPERLAFDDLTLREVPVRLGGQAYVLREASVAAACQYRNAILRAGRFGADGKVQAYEDLADIEPLLVSLCLFEADGGRPVSLATVKRWPARLLQPLYRQAKALSELDLDTVEGLEQQIREAQDKLTRLRAEPDPAKNGQSATAPISP
jgi:hypothetical protein